MGEAGFEALAQAIEEMRVLIACEDDLLILACEGLEDVEESLHRLFFRTEELDVVEEQDVDFFAEERGEGLVGLVVRAIPFLFSAICCLQSPLFCWRL